MWGVLRSKERSRKYTGHVPVSSSLLGKFYNNGPAQKDFWGAGRLPRRRPAPMVLYPRHYSGKKVNFIIGMLVAYTCTPPVRLYPPIPPYESADSNAVSEKSGWRARLESSGL